MKFTFTSKFYGWTCKSDDSSFTIKPLGMYEYSWDPFKLMCLHANFKFKGLFVTAFKHPSSCSTDCVLIDPMNVLNLIKCSHLECIWWVWGLQDNDGKPCLQSALVETLCSYFLSGQIQEGSRFNKIKEKCLKIFVLFVKLTKHFARKNLFISLLLLWAQRKSFKKYASGYRYL